jgi:hypothetical protein
MLILVTGAFAQLGNFSTVPSDIVLLQQQFRSTGEDNDLLQGTVQNIGNNTAKSVRIVMSTFDKNGEVMQVDAINGSLGTLVAGQKLAFNFSVPQENAFDMYDYSLSLQWVDGDGELQKVEDVSTYAE